MKPQVNFLLSLIIALLLYPKFDWTVLFIFIGGVLIDIDHYLWYIYKFRKLNFFECYKFYLARFDKEKIKDVIGILLIFHTIEFLLAMMILSFYFESILFVTIGLVSHHILDLIFLYTVPKCIVANHSLILWIIKNKFKSFK